MPRSPCCTARVLVAAAGLAMMQACVGGAPTSSAGLPATTATEDDAGSSEGGPPAPEAAAFPAVAPSMPAIESAGGSVLAAPRIVPVFFPGETRATMLGDAIGKYVVSAEWRAATSQYGVGPTTAAPAVQSTDALPPSIATADLGTWLTAHLDGTHPEWGPTDEATVASSIFVLYAPAGTTIYAPEEDPSDPMAVTLCGPRPWDIEGWHWQTTPAPGSGPAIVFALVGACTYDGVTIADRMTSTTTHELAEAATDPLFFTSPAYASVDEAHAFWMELTGGGEVGDLCERDLVTPPDVGYPVQRIWSNAASSAGHDPCVPATAPAYFNVAADAPDAFFDPYAGVKVRGVAIQPHASRTIDMHLLSDVPTDAWQVTAVDPNAAQGGAQLLKLTLDHDVGANGDVLHLTIQPLFDAPGVTALYEIDSKLHEVTQRWYGEIVVR